MAETKKAIGFRKTATKKVGAFKPARANLHVSGGILKPAKKGK